MNFWKTLKKPIYGLAPMDGVTDEPFRRMVALFGKPDVIFTEFTSAEGIKHKADRVLDAFIYSEIERPVVAQLFGSDPEAFYLSAFVVCELGFDGLDINMGCPDKNVAKKGGGAALILNPKKAQEIILASKKGISDWFSGKSIKDIGLSDEILSKVEYIKDKFNIKAKKKKIPVSVKTRIGYDKVVTEKWIANLLEVEPSVISIHGRTLKQLYSGDASWDEIKKAVFLRDALKKETLILGNGDIKDLNQAKERVDKFGVDGVLIGRATFGNPWFFSGKTPTPKDRINAALKHLDIYYEVFGDFKFHNIKKHLAWYISGFSHSKELRMMLMQTKNKKEAETILKDFLKNVIHN